MRLSGPSSAAVSLPGAHCVGHFVVGLALCTNGIALAKKSIFSERNDEKLPNFGKLSDLVQYVRYHSTNVGKAPRVHVAAASQTMTAFEGVSTVWVCRLQVSFGFVEDALASIATNLAAICNCTERTQAK